MQSNFSTVLGVGLERSIDIL
uniref:Uncharacterized protein n=1 Tax=Arundo donax TaxID=35708 RepID=A0A0A8YEH7_ARUDO